MSEDYKYRHYLLKRIIKYHACYYSLFLFVLSVLFFYVLCFWGSLELLSISLFEIDICTFSVVCSRISCGLFA